MLDSLVISQLFILATAHFFAVVSPGPDFAVVIKQSVRFGRKNAIYTSIGIGSAILIHVAYSALGIALLIKQSPWLFQLLKYACAVYLVYIGVKSLQAQPAPADASIAISSTDADESLSSSFKLGFITNVLNPKATLFFLAVFSAVVSQETPALWLGVYAGYLALATACWFSLVSVIFSSDKVRQKFLSFGHYFDRLMGVILIALALHVVLS